MLLRRIFFCVLFSPPRSVREPNFFRGHLIKAFRGNPPNPHLCD
jgi:hypothetical protein